MCSDINLFSRKVFIELYSFAFFAKFLISLYKLNNDVFGGGCNSSIIGCIKSFLVVST